MENVRVFSTGFWPGASDNDLAVVIRYLNPTMLEELSIDARLDYDDLQEILRNGAPWPRLTILRLDLGRQNVVESLEVISQSCTTLRQLHLSALPLLFNAYDLLRSLRKVLKSNESTLDHLSLNWRLCDAIEQFSNVTSIPTRWNELQDIIINSLYFLPTSLMIDGLSLWGSVVVQNRIWIPECESLFSIIHQYPTIDALRNLSAVMAAGVELTEGGIEFFLSQLYRWQNHFEKHPIESRRHVNGWSYYRDCLGHLFHIAGTMWSREIRKLLVTCPSILDTISLRNSSPRPWSSSALTTLIGDTQWWKQQHHQSMRFNSTEKMFEGGPHPIVYLARDGEALLCAIQSPLLSWDRPEYQQNRFFSDLLQLALRCQYNVDSYNRALKIIYQKVIELNLRPIEAPLTKLQFVALSKIAPIKSCLVHLTSNCQVLIHEAHLFAPWELYVALTKVASADLPREILYDAAAAYWRPIVFKYDDVRGNRFADTKALYSHLLDAAANFPVVPLFVFRFCSMPTPHQAAKNVKVVIHQLLQDLNVKNSADRDHWIS
jgi:hypothetical protein